MLGLRILLIADHVFLRAISRSMFQEACSGEHGQLG